MNTVNRSKNLNWQSLPKKRGIFLLRKLLAYLPTMVFGALLGTYLDLFFVGMKFYSFPNRPLPHIFSINILFCLAGLPLIVLLYLIVVKRLSFSGRLVSILLLSLLMSVFERVSEEAGFFDHSEEWKHYYSIIGFMIYWFILSLFFRGTNQTEGKE